MRRMVGFLALPIMLAACGTAGDDEYDPALLAQYRAAIPSKATLAAPTLQARSQRAVGDPAMYPHEFGPMAIAINGAVGDIIDTMKAVVDLPPSYYNMATREFVWGPWPNDSDYGTVAAYVKEQPPGSDFRYVYALLRGTSEDLSTMTPVIWGGANPDPASPDNGSGVTLWDFEANHAFAQAHDPDYASKQFDRGRFVALYAAGPDEDDPANHVTLVVAVFRNFVPKDKIGDPAIDLDYLYGNVKFADGTTVDFADFAAGVDVAPETGDGTLEDITVRMALVNGGMGRAEAAAAGGTLTADQHVDVIECWDSGLDRTFVDYTYTDATASQTYTEPAGGTPTLCGGPMVDPGTGTAVPLFSLSLDQLQIPSLADVPADLLAAMDDVAQNGAPSE